MKILNLVQGSPEWKAHRATAFNASDAPAMLGISKYKTRAQLIKERATGIVPEVDDSTQRRFNDGHRFEALARPLAEEIIGEELSPVTGERDEYSASFDGITFDQTVIFEHKTMNDDLRAVLLRDGVTGADLDEQYQVQMEHQLTVSDAEKCLFMATKWGANDELLECLHCWYYPNQALRNRIGAGWVQFKKDVAAYVPSEVKEMPKAEVTIDLPALFVHAKGEITTHNMDEFGNALTAKLAETRAIALVTDQDFSNAKEAAKKFRDTAKAIALSKEQMLAQTETIGEAARKMDAWAKDLNATALQLEKDVEREDKAKKETMVLKAYAEFRAHVDALEAETRPIKISVTQPDFAAAIKGKRNYASMQDAVDTALAMAQIRADEAASDVRFKLEWCKLNAAGHHALFPDLQTLMSKPMEDFTLTITSRIEKQKADDAAKLEAETLRIRAEEEAKATAKAKADAEDILAAERAKQAEEESARKARDQAMLDAGSAKNNPQSEAVMQDGARPALVQTEPAAQAPVLSDKAVADAKARSHLRPTRVQMIEVIALHYYVAEETAFDWLRSEFAEVAA
jgi:putative phage-type endonuclease